MNKELSMSRWVLAVSLAAILPIQGCSESAEVMNVSDEAGKSSASEAVIATKAITKKPAQNKGVVKSNALAGGYSYIEVDVSGDTFWLATSITDVKPGDKIVWKDHAIMANFESKALNRKFSQILFVDRVIAESAMAARTHSGTVIESMNSGGYSYIQVEENGARIWLAAPETRVDIGQSIRWSSGAPMRNFTSKSLNRNFDEIFFIAALQAS